MVRIIELHIAWFSIVLQDIAWHFGISRVEHKSKEQEYDKREIEWMYLVYCQKGYIPSLDFFNNICAFYFFTTLLWLLEQWRVISRSLVLTRLFFPKQRNKRHQKAKQPSPQVYIKVGWLQWIWWLKHRVWLSLNCKSENHPTKIYCSFSPTC